jgi:hypothetical protein
MQISLSSKGSKATSKVDIERDEEYRRIMKIHANRTFQLAEASVEEAQNAQMNSVDLKELLEKSIEHYERAKSSFAKLKLSPARIVYISIKLSYVSLLNQDSSKAETYIEEADVYLKSIGARQYENFDIPESILKQYINVQRGLILKTKCRTKEAVEYFTTSLVEIIIFMKAL